MSEYVAFGMKFGRLLDANHGGDFGQDFREQAGVVQHLEGGAGGAGFSEQAEEFVADAFSADAPDVRGELADGVGGGGFDGEA